MSLITSFTPLIQTSLKNIIYTSKGSTILFNELISQTSNGCLSKDNTLNLINKRNNLVNEINKLNNTLSKISGYVDIINSVLTVSKSIIAVFKANPAPSQFTTVGLIISLNDIFNKTKDVIEQISSIISSIKYLLNYIIENLNNLMKLLQSLDFNLNKCLNTYSLSSSLLNNPNPINIKPNDNILQQYKGYTFDIKIDENNYTVFKKRYAVALNSYGREVLRSESSFASDPNILIDELKFQIDHQNL